MDMHAAALPPIHGPVYAEDMQHPRYAEYRSYRSGMTRLMVEASGFKVWLASVERDERDGRIMQHPRFREFQAWMRQTQAGGRKCPAGNAFPQNFYHWLEGGRW